MKTNDDILKKILELTEIFVNNKQNEINYKSVPITGKVIGASEAKKMVEASLDGWLTTGRFNDEFQKKLANFLKVKNLITTN